MCVEEKECDTNLLPVAALCALFPADTTAGELWTMWWRRDYAALQSVFFGN